MTARRPSGNNKIYVFGGTDGTNVSTPSTSSTSPAGTWSTGPAMPALRQQMGIGVYNGNIYLAGGDDSHNAKPQTTLYQYDVLGNSWTTKAALPQALRAPARA